MIRAFVATTWFGLWYVSLYLPVATSHQSHGQWARGIDVFNIGWLGLAFLQPAWLGNVWLWTGCAALLATGKLSRGFAPLFAVFIAAALSWRTFESDAGSDPITAYGSGYYLWLACMAFGCGAPWLLLRFAPPPYSPEPDYSGDLRPWMRRDD